MAEMPSERNRVYVSDEKEAPDDALVRQSDNGNKYYCPSERGRNSHTGGNKENDLLNETSKGRRYISDPSEAPEDVDVQEGDQGGYYYETGDGGGDDGSSGDAPGAVADQGWGPEWGEYEEGSQSRGELGAEAVLDAAGGVEEVQSEYEANPDIGPQEAAEPVVDHFMPELEGEDRENVIQEIASYIEPEEDGPDYDSGEEGGDSSGGTDQPHPNKPQEVAEYLDQEIGFSEVASNASAMADSRREAMDIAMDEVEAGLEARYGDRVDTARVMDEVERRLIDEVASHMERSQKVYIGSEDDAPDGVAVKEDDLGLFYRQNMAYQEERAFYPDDTEESVEDETDVDLEDAEMPEDGGVPSEEVEDQRREDLREQTEEQYGKGGGTGN